MKTIMIVIFSMASIFFLLFILVLMKVLPNERCKCNDDIYYIIFTFSISNNDPINDASTCITMAISSPNHNKSFTITIYNCIVMSALLLTIYKSMVSICTVLLCWFKNYCTLSIVLLMIILGLLYCTIRSVAVDIRVVVLYVTFCSCI